MRYVRRVNLATVSQCRIRPITLFQPSGHEKGDMPRRRIPLKSL